MTRPVARTSKNPDVALSRSDLPLISQVREYLDQGGAANARAPGRAGGDWTLLMAAAEGGKDGREVGGAGHGRVAEPRAQGV